MVPKVAIRRGSNKYQCLPIYKCKCASRPRARSTALRHKRMAEMRLREETNDRTLVLAAPRLYEETCQVLDGGNGLRSSQSGTLTDGTEPSLSCEAIAKQNHLRIIDESSTSSSQQTKGTTLSPSSLANCQTKSSIYSPLYSSINVNAVGDATKRRCAHSEVSDHKMNEASVMLPAESCDSSTDLRENVPTSQIEIPSMEVIDESHAHLQAEVENDSLTTLALSYAEDYSRPDSSLCSFGDGVQLDAEERRLFHFLERHSDIVRFWLKHKITDSAMDDLLQMHNAIFKSWKGLRQALVNREGLTVTDHNMCSTGHQYLGVSSSGLVDKCSYKDCNSPPKTYGYMEIKSRLEVRLRSATFGPQLFEHYHSELDKGLGDDPLEYRDIFSGRLFNDAVETLGGKEAIRDDIFLILNGDGAQPYKSTTYDLWPFVCFIANLPPSERVSSKNILPLFCIPGPNQPKDLPSMLTPFLQEMKRLQEGFEVSLWDGRHATVRCHVLLSQGDLQALSKLCCLKGCSGSSPCRYCEIRGVWDVVWNHTYYPSFVMEDGRRIETFRVTNIPLRTETSIRKALSDLERLRVSQERGSITALKALQTATGINGSSVLFEQARSLKMFRSCPVDIMHLLVMNIPGDIIDLLTSNKLLSAADMVQINRNLEQFGSGVPSETRRPRSLKLKGSFKAEEWKFFVLHASLVVFDQILDKEFLDGWRLFVELVDLCFRPALSGHEVIQLGKYARKFYQFYERYFYGGDTSMLHVCKYTIHLLLHLEESTRDAGPLLNVSQFPMERFIGESVHGLNAKNLAAESMFGHWIFKEAYKSYCIRSNISPKDSRFAFNPIRYSPREGLHTLSNNPDFKGIVFCHPRLDSTVADYEDHSAFPLRRLLSNFYMKRLGLSQDQAKAIMSESPDITLWSRMAYKEQFDDESRVVYFGMLKPNAIESSRRNCYFAAEYGVAVEDSDSDTGDGDEEKEVYYGRTRQFIEHSIDLHGEKLHFMLTLSEWVVRGLKKGQQGQVFAATRRDARRLFSELTIDGVDVVQRNISVVETSRSEGKQTRYRTYFVDSQRLKDGLLERSSSKKLKGFR